MVAACGPGPGTDRPAAEAGTRLLHRGNGPEPSSLDPHRATGIPAANILRDLFEGLTTLDAAGEVIPGAAASWQVSADGLEWTFRLRADGRWSNGDPVTAQDFVYGLRRAVDPATLSDYAGVLAPLANAAAIGRGERPVEALGVAAPDPGTVVLTLEFPAPYLPELLSHPMTFPLHRASVEAAPGGFARPGRLVSNGPFLLQEWVLHSRLTLAPNPYHRDRAALRLDGVVYHPIEDPAAELARYRAGELHWTDAVPHQQLGWIRELLAGELVVAPYFALYYYGFNLTRPPFAGRPGLRRALAMVVDRERLVEHITGGGERPACAWIPTLPGYAGPVPEWAGWPMERRLAEARALYAEAGYDPGYPLVTEIRYNTSENHRRVALAVAAMWREALGVETRLVNEEFRVFLQNRRRKEDTELFRASWTGDYRAPMSFAEVMLSGHGRNDTGYASARYDGLVAAARRAVDPAVRARFLAEAEALLLADQPVLPLYFYVTRRLVKPGLKGWQDNLLDYHPSRYMYLEYAE